nr:hypothetical protein [Spirochaeta sp.]
RGIQSVSLLTNNPAKIDDLTSLGIRVSNRVALEPQTVNANNRKYLFTKMRRMNHILDLEEPIAGGGVGSTAAGG